MFLIQVSRICHLSHIVYVLGARGGTVGWALRYKLVKVFRNIDV